MSRSQTSAPRFWAALSGTTIAVLVLDQLSKAWVLAHADELSRARPAVGLTLLWNTAVAFSLPLSGIWVYVAAAAVLGIVVPMLARSLDRGTAGAGAVLGLLLGGAAGNLIDRARFGAVVDFVKVGPWPVFNVADAAISISIVVLLLFGKRLSPREHGTAITELGFNEKLVPLVVSGEQIVTIRANPAYASLRAGDELAAVHTQAGRRFGTITLAEVRRMPLGSVLLPIEGYVYQTREELRAELQRYYPEPVTDATQVYVIRFKLSCIDAHALAELGLHALQH